MHRVTRFLTLAVLFSTGAIALAQERKTHQCSPAGVWYGGSVVAYRMTIIPTEDPGRFIGLAEGMYKNSIMNTSFAGEFTRKGNRYEGTSMSLTTQDPEYLNPPPFSKLPDMAIGWMSMRMLDCNTLQNTIPMYGLYFGPPATPGSGFWQPGTPWTGIDWITNGKRILIDPPDVDLIPILTGDTKPIVETYHRVPGYINPVLLHTN